MKKPADKGTRTMAVELTAQIRRRLKVYVAANDLRIKTVVNDALDEYLKKRSA